MKINLNQVADRLLLLFTIMLIAATGYTQNYNLDSMLKVLPTQQQDTNKINTLIRISGNYYNAGNVKEALIYFKQIEQLSEKLQYKKGLSFGYFILALVYYSQNDYVQALNYYYKGLPVFKELKDSLLLGQTLQSMGATNFIIGDTTEALNNYLACLQLRQQVNNKAGVAQTYNSIGEIYCKQGRYAEAMEKHLAALKICEEPGFKGYGWDKAYSYQCIGNVFEKQGDEAKIVSNIEGNKNVSAVLHQKALEKYEDSYKIWYALQEGDALSPALAELNYAIGNVHLKLHHFGLAEEKLQQSLNTSLQIENKEFLNDIYLALSLLDSAKGNYKLAYEHYKLYTFYKKINNDQDIARKAEGFKMRSQFEKKETELKLLSAQSKLQTILAKEQNQKKNIAYAGIGLILLTGGYGFYRFRKRKSIQGQRALTDERLRISQELHDEVGATLSGIAMYSHLTKEQIKHAQTAEVEKSLTVMQQSAGDMVNKLNDIVWLINPGQDTLQKLLQHLEEYAGDMAAIKNLEVKIIVPDQFSTQILPVKSRRNIYLFCKEAINNAVKYSEATILELSVKENKQSLEITITDNGKGFDTDNIKRGNGLNNMQQRAYELGADFNMQSKTGEGCIILLKVKITR